MYFISRANTIMKLLNYLKGHFSEGKCILLVQHSMFSFQSCRRLRDVEFNIQVI